MTNFSDPSFIVIEGLDGTGKSTLAVKLAERLPAVCLRTPPDELQNIRETIDNTYCECGIATQLFYGSTVAYISDKIRSFISRGQSVVVDRYWLSTHVYARCRNDSVDLSVMVPKLQKPHMTVWLDLDDGVRQQRMQKRGKITDADRASIQHHKKLREIYQQAFSLPLAGYVFEIDTGKLNPDQCADYVIQELTRTLAA